MAVRDRRKIRKSLKKKGFVQEERKRHEAFILFDLDENLTDIFTVISRGGAYKQYGSRLLGYMAEELKLSNQELLQLIDCDLEHSDYIAILEQKGEL